MSEWEFKKRLADLEAWVNVLTWACAAAMFTAVYAMAKAHGWIE